MKALLLLSILNINLSCNNNPKGNLKTLKNDKQLIEIVDSIENANKSSLITLNKIESTAKKDTIIQDNTQYEDFLEEAIVKMFKQKNILYLNEKLNELEKDNVINKSNKIYWSTYLNLKFN